MRVFRLALFAVIATVALKAAPASAGVLLEPYVGYKIGKFKASGSTDLDYTAPAAGLRLGVTFPIVFLAADYSAILSGKVKAGSVSNDVDSNNQLFAEVGASLPLVRAYLGYGLMNEVTFKGGSKFKDGTAIKLGVGTTILPMVAINLEYVTSSYNKDETGSKIDVKSDIYMLGVSIPFNL